MKKISISLIIFFISFSVYADRYIEDGLRGSSGGFFDIIIGIVFAIGALIYFVDSFSKWKVRQAKDEKPEQIDGVAEWSFFLFAYAIISAFACIPVLLILKIIGGADFVREYWLWGFILFFSILTYLKRT
ncbi:hypothetical protein B9T36_09755 [Acinetobacter sp. ANC 4204]|uniref:putative four-helix membrane protein n=1 Tax=Acinetobacter sp. ANC 4204 TaxID=1977884 RepID=UPI000A358A05|nr:putative four-helix membrane protein [Acinetobacter sp. ANC 4204]OTG58631.1 hypothetical protein B9T36_09755 [Acinetobacter sp. ANC 4204]